MPPASPLSSPRAAQVGVVCAIGAAVAFSLNDMVIKFLSDGYPLHQIVLIRSLIGLALIVGLIAPFEGGWSALKTRRPFAHMARGGFVVLANTTFFLALAAMPLANATAIFFVAPMIITGLSVFLLGEQVGPRRWTAVAIGLIGVLFIMRPASDGFQIAALLPIVAAFCYAALHIFTRRMGVTERASTLAIYIQLTFVIVSAGVGLLIGDGAFDVYDDPSLGFLLSAWLWPSIEDLALMAGLGLCSAMGGYLISQAYRVSEAGLIAPFEYVSLVMSIFWGFAIFGETPDALAGFGIVLILSSGLFLAVREARTGSAGADLRRR